MRFGLRHILNRAVRPGNERQAKRARRPSWPHLVAHRPDMFGLGPDENQLMLFDDFGKARVFREEAIAGMDRVRAADLSGGNDRGDVEVAVLGGRRPDADRFIRQTDVHRIGVGGRMDRNRLDPHFMRSAVDAQRDLAAIGDQQLFDGHSMTTSG